MEHQHQQKYTCPMHPEILQANTGNCPKCGMTLVLVKSEGDKSASPHQDISSKLGPLMLVTIFLQIVIKILR